jgi:hypothetical protein
MEELPHKLKVELAMAVHKKMYSCVKFFDNQDKNFIAWIAKLIRPLKIDDQEYIYKEGEEVVEMYFVVKGVAAYVLPRLGNIVFKEIP